MIRNENGFSFIELMVVVIILGILAGMIVPRYMGRTDDAKVIKAKMDIAAIGICQASCRLFSYTLFRVPQNSLMPSDGYLRAHSRA